MDRRRREGEREENTSWRIWLNWQSACEQGVAAHTAHCSGGGSRGNKGLSLPRNLAGTFSDLAQNETKEIEA